MSLLEGKSRIVLKLFLLVIPFTLILVFVEIQAHHLDELYPRKSKIIETRINDIELLILGSSHSFAAINPGMFTKNSFSLAYPSQDLYYDCSILLKYINRFSKLKYLILVVSDFSLGYSQNDEWLQKYYTREFNIFPPTYKSKNSIKNYSFVSILGLQKTISILSTPITDMDSNGFVTNKSVLKKESQNKMNKDGLRMAKRHERMYSNNLIAVNRDYIIRIIDIAEINNIEIAIVTTPCTSYYYNGINKAILETMYSNINQIKGNRNVKYFNYLNDNRFDDEDFYDYDHLNYDGANKFSRILNDTLKEKY